MDSSSCADIQATVSTIEDVLLQPGNDWDTLLALARDLVAFLEAISFFTDPNLLASQIHTVDVLQRLAYHDVDVGGVADIADWCLERWLQIHHQNPGNIDVLKGRLVFISSTSMHI
jgi:hypothetical protein